MISVPKRSKSERVVITGMGAVTPLGLDLASSWQGIKEGRSGAAPIEQFSANDWPVNFACEVKNFSFLKQAVLPQHLQLLNRPAEFVAAAAVEAMASAGDLRGYAEERFAILTGSGIGCIRPQQILSVLQGYDLRSDLSGMAAFLEECKNLPVAMAAREHPGTISGILAERWNARAPWESHATACSAGAQAIVRGAERIRSGEIDVALCGGGDSIAGELLLAGFCLLGVLSQRNSDPKAASRPFDKDRDGLVAGEGGAMLVLERMDLAEQRGAKIIAEVLGAGVSENAYRITDLPPDGLGAIAAMHGAIKMAGKNLSDVDYINAHGTSTEQNDRIEAQAIAELFGTDKTGPQVSSTKGQTGHFIAAAGAVEAVFTAKAIAEQVFPATINLHETDCAPLNFVGPVLKAGAIKMALSNSFGFGGTNVCLAFGKGGDS